MKVRTIPSFWVKKNGYRFDCNPYLSGSIEAKEKLESLKCLKEPLKDITLGLVNAGRIKRLWAESSEYGRPFLSSTDILKTDLSNIKSISHKAVEANPKLLIKKGWSLITRAGSIGKMSYCRPDMDGM
ncbi:restriction endonuclease subunit S, partial [Vibrio fluvialis]